MSRRSNLKLKAAQPEMQERRESKRIPFYRGEFPDAKIHIGGKVYEAEVFDLSTNGIGIIPKGEIPGLDTISQKVLITLGTTQAREATLKNISHIKFAGSLRLKLGMHTSGGWNSKVKHETFFSCTENMPLAYCNDPIAFNQTILFNVSHFFKSGLVLRSKFIRGAFFPGLTIDLRLMMPARGEFKAAAEVIEVSRSKDQVEMVCKWRHISPELTNSISEFLLMTVPNLTIQVLKEEGFLVADLEKAFLFKSAQSTEEMEKILKLRLIAAKGEGRWLDTNDFTLMRDQWDSYARQIYCEVNGQLVSASRIVFNNGLPERSEHVSYKVNIPDWLWEAGFVEGSRVCTDPAFRGVDVFTRMIQQMSYVVIQSGHRYFLMNCVDKLLPIYKKIVGVKSLGQRFHTPFMQKDALNLLYIDVRSLHVGTNARHQTWVINVPVGNTTIQKGHLKLSWWERGLRFFFSPFHSAAMLLFRKKKYMKAKKAIENNKPLKSENRSVQPAKQAQY